MNRKQKILLTILAVILFLVINFWVSDERNKNVLFREGLPFFYLLAKILQFLIPAVLIYLVLGDKK